MLPTRIADIFEPSRRFMRSVYLERDFHDDGALKGYVVTPLTRSGLERLAGGLSPKSTQRAWRITGDYGTGKSSFALALAHLFAGRSRSLPAQLSQAVSFKELGVTRPQLLPVLVSGSRAPIAAGVLEALGRSIESTCLRGARPLILGRVLKAAANAHRGKPVDDDALRLIAEAVAYIRSSGKGSGVLVVLDELGKFLEFAALHPERQDIYFLQRLAETAARSGEEPLLVIGLLHQGFSAYAEQLSQAAQKEWEKVAGRFDEILFDQPLEQIAGLVADALNVRLPRVPREATQEIGREMVRTIDLGWFGSAVVRNSMVERAARLYPLHPTVLPVLVRLFSRFGQNERSLFSFLLSNEPFALQSFSEQPLNSGTYYRIHNVFDYTRAAFGHRLGVQSYRSHWNQIESVVESYPQDRQLELQILKTVAVLNLLDTPGLLATDDTVALAVGATTPETAARTKAVLKSLQRDRSVLYFRGAAGGYCLWPHTSVNLERAHQDAKKAVQTPSRVAALMQEELDARPLVARRHYIETGNLRHFDVRYVTSSELADTLSDKEGAADGCILVALCENEEEVQEARRAAQTEVFQERDDVLIAVPSPLQGLANLFVEVQRWEWIAHSVPELAQDAYAMEEVSRQLAASRQVLERCIRSYVGLRQFSEPVGLRWFHCGRPINIQSGRDVLTKLSEICDRVYRQAPRLKNELVNRHSLSSAATAARLRLIDRLLTSSTAPSLGMDPANKPPEMSMYLSVLKAAKLHREQRDAWAVMEPEETDDPCNVRPVLRQMLHLLEQSRDRRLQVTQLFEAIKRPPFGVRDGMAPLLLAVFAVIHEQDVAFYEGGAFLRQLSGQEFQRLAKAPETFELQYCKVTGVRAVLFEKLLRLLDPSRMDARKIDILDVVRPLCVFAAQLPIYTQKTSTVSSIAVAVREALLRAEEPATLLFHQLPAACAIEPFESDQPASPDRVKVFVDKLRLALDDLRLAYPGLTDRIKSELVTAFDRPGNLDQLREDLSTAAERMLVAVTEPRLKAFCLRLADHALGEQAWLESIGSFLCSKPPARWLDLDFAAFQEELRALTGRFRRVESAVFQGSSDGRSSALRVAVTAQDGTEVERIVHVNASEETIVAKLEASFLRTLREEKRLGLVAVSRALRRCLQEASDE